MNLKRETLLVLGVVGVVIAIIMFIHYYSVRGRTDEMLFGLTQLLFGFGIGVVFGTYLGLKSERARLERLILPE